MQILFFWLNICIFIPVQKWVKSSHLPFVIFSPSNWHYCSIVHWRKNKPWHWCWRFVFCPNWIRSHPIQQAIQSKSGAATQLKNRYFKLSSNRMRNNYTFKQFPMNIGYDSDFFLATTFSLLDGSEKIKPRKRKAEPFERIILYRTYYLCVRGLWIPFNWKMTSRREVVNKLKTDWRQTRPEEICLNSPAPQMATVWRTLSQGRDWPFLLNNPWPS